MTSYRRPAPASSALQAHTSAGRQSSIANAHTPMPHTGYGSIIATPRYSNLISFTSPSGGIGLSTITALVALTLSTQDIDCALLDADIPVRQIEEDVNVPMYNTNIPCTPAGVFSGNMVVSMRPIPYAQVPAAVAITAGMPRVHGAPVQIGIPEAIGITDLAHPDYGDAVTIRPGETPVFWPCGVTPQAVVMHSKPEFCITHAPGHMFVTDVKNTALKF